MRWTILALLAAAALPATAEEQPLPTPLPAPVVVSTGREVALVKRLVPERPTVFVFLKPSSTLELAFLETLRRDAGEKVGFRLIRLQSGSEPIARRYEVKTTPTAIVYDRRGRIVARSADAGAIKAAVRKAAGVMRIDWAEEDDPRFEEAIRLRGGKRPLPGIMRTMSLKPEYMGHIHELAQVAHFADGFIDRRTKEMIATYVSSLNHCKY